MTPRVDLEYTTFKAYTPWGHVYTADVNDAYGKKQAVAMSSGTYERGIMNDTIQNAEYDVFIDLGASHGYYTLMAAAKHHVKRVIAIDAHPVRFGHLWTTTRGKPKIQLIYGFVGDVDTKFAASVNPGGLVGKQGSSQGLGAWSPPVYSMEYIIGQSVEEGEKALIKMDIEGYEKEVLESLPQETIDSAIWLVEIHKQMVDEDYILSFFKDRDVKVLYDHRPGKIVSVF